MIPPRELPKRINGAAVIGTFEYYLSGGQKGSYGSFYLTEDMLEDLRKLRDKAEQSQRRMSV